MLVALRPRASVMRRCTTLVPRRRFLEVVGIVSFGVYQVDDTHAFVSLETAKQLLDRVLADASPMSSSPLDALDADDEDDLDTLLTLG